MRSRYGTIKKLGDGYYHVFWTKDKRRRSKRIHGTLKDAQAFLAAKQLDRFDADSSMTMQQYWELMVEPTFGKLSDRTRYDYTHLWDTRLSPVIGRTKVASLTWRNVQQALDTVDSPSVQRYCYRLLKKICNMAVRDNLLASNPVDASIRLAKPTKRSDDVYTSDEVVGVLENAAGYKHAYLVALELGGGLRHEEACAVERGDIDEDGRGHVIVHVSKALTVAGGKRIEKGTKTELSVRTVAIGEPFASTIAANMDKIPTSASLQSVPTTITRNWAEWCRRHGIRHLPFGRMRSSYATMACECCDSSLVSMVMGHSDGTTRGKYYQKVTEQTGIIVADCLTEYILGA